MSPPAWRQKPSDAALRMPAMSTRGPPQPKQASARQMATRREQGVQEVTGAQWGGWGQWPQQQQWQWYSMPYYHEQHEPYQMLVQPQYQTYPDDDQPPKPTPEPVTPSASVPELARPKPPTLVPLVVYIGPEDDDSDDEEEPGEGQTLVASEEARVSLAQDLEYITAALDHFYTITAEVLHDHAEHYRAVHYRPAVPAPVSKDQQQPQQQPQQQALQASASFDQSMLQHYVYVQPPFAQGWQHFYPSEYSQQQYANQGFAGTPSYSAYAPQ